LELAHTRQFTVAVGDPQTTLIKFDKWHLVRIGEQAPDFTVTTLAGKQAKLSDLRGKVVLLDFWATWCAPCIAELPNVKSAHDEFGKDGEFVVLGISLDTKADTVRSFMKGKQFPWEQAVLGPAETNPVAQKYFVAGIPATFLIDREGKVVGRDLRGRALHQALRTQFRQVKEKSAQASPTD